MKEQEFKVGDIVEAFGLRGRVEGVDIGDIYPLRVDFGEYSDTFTADGRQRVMHTVPSLKLIERPRKTKKVKVWVNCGLIGSMTYPAVYTHPAEENAREAATSDMLTQQIEVEVLDE